MPPNQVNTEAESDANMKVDSAMANSNYRINMNNPQEVIASSDSSAFSRMSSPAPKSPSPVTSGLSPAHVSTTSSSVQQGGFKSQVPDPIGSSVEWEAPSQPQLAAPAENRHPASGPAPGPGGAATAAAGTATAQPLIASKGGIRHNIVGIPNMSENSVAGNNSTTVAQTGANPSTGSAAPGTAPEAMAVDVPLAGAQPLNVLSAGTPSPLGYDAAPANASGHPAAHAPAPGSTPLVQLSNSSVKTNMNLVPSPVTSKNPPSTAPTETKERSFSMQLQEATSTYQSLSFHAGSSGSGNHSQDVGTASDRKQKRLQRNRESARLSRKRRKQYLEVLETRVNYLCEEMDRGRREHVLGALKQIVSLRSNVLSELEQADRMQNDQELQQKIMMLGKDGILSRTSAELMMAITFGREYLKSLVIPPSKKFIMWLTLQNDIFYRGGRAASERLSAARIGEKVRFWMSQANHD
jgi:hypothetical protein